MRLPAQNFQLTKGFLQKRSPLELWAIELHLRGYTEEEVRQRWKKIPKRLRNALQQNWSFRGRPDQQLPVGDWTHWVCLAGRGWGKTATGANAVKTWTETDGERIALVGATAADVRDVMVEGESGILAQYPKDRRPVFIKSQRCVRFYNGAKAFCYSAEEPERLRGPQHHQAWCDELAAWFRVRETWDQLKFGLRLGRHPRSLSTTTPKAIALVKELVRESKNGEGRVVLTKGTTFDNAMNLPADFLAEMLSSFGGTRLGRQELNGEVLEEVDALFKRPWFRSGPRPSEFRRVVVAIDPAISRSKDSDETGIVVVGLGQDGFGYVLADLSGKQSPDAWVRKAVRAYYDFGASLIIAETNRGGDMVEHAVYTFDKGVQFEAVHAFRGKDLRAEPVAALYEQGKIIHVEGADLKQLEDQMADWNPRETPDSPDRLDALVWALTEILCGGGGPTIGGDLPKRSWR